MAIDFTGGSPGQVVVISIPDWGITPFARGRNRNQITRQINRFNRVNRRITSRSGAVYIDITKLYRCEGTLREMLAEDGLHPSGRMYRLWSDRLLPAVLHILAEN
jgi:lysophospholipase L1-like esterase